MPQYPRFETHPYQPEGGFTPAGSATLLLASLMAGLVLGIVAGFVARWFYLILIFPAAIGAGVGGAGYLAIRHGKVRNTVLGAMSGLLGGFFAMLSMHYLAYMQFEREMNAVPPQVREFERKAARMTPEQLRQDPMIPDEFRNELADPVKRAGYAVDSFWTYMQFRATAGVTFTKASRPNDKGMNLGYIGSWIYWIVEVFIVAGIALGIQYVAAREPFCPRCQQWKTTRQLGAVPVEDVGPLTEGNLEHFATPPPAGAQPAVMVSISECLCGPESTVDVKLAQMIPTGEGMNFKELAHVTYPGEALEHLQMIFMPIPVPESAAPSSEAGGPAQGVAPAASTDFKPGEPGR